MFLSLCEPEGGNKKLLDQFGSRSNKDTYLTNCLENSFKFTPVLGKIQRFYHLLALK